MGAHFRILTALWVALIGVAASGSLSAQAPVQDLTSREQAIQRGQLSAGAAYRELQEARHQAKLAEQDYLNAQDRLNVAQKQAAATKKALAEARTREAQARKRYDEALSNVDRAFKLPPDKPK